MRKKDGFSCWYKAMTAVIRKGTHFYRSASLETGRGIVANASPLAEPVRRTPGLGNGELRRAFCPYPDARSRAHCLGVGGVALDWAVPTRREDKAAARLRRQIAVGAQGIPAGALPPPFEPRQCTRMPQLTGSAPPRAAG